MQAGSGTLLLEGRGLADPGEPVPAVPADPRCRGWAQVTQHSGVDVRVMGRLCAAAVAAGQGGTDQGGFVLPSEGLTVRIPPLKDAERIRRPGRGGGASAASTIPVTMC